MFVDTDKRYNEYIVGDKIKIGDIRILNSGVICLVNQPNTRLSCLPCMYQILRVKDAEGNECIPKMSKDLGMVYNLYCYASLRCDSIRITKILSKSLFLASIIKWYIK